MVGVVEEGVGKRENKGIGVDTSIIIHIILENQ